MGQPTWRQVRRLRTLAIPLFAGCLALSHQAIVSAPPAPAKDTATGASDAQAAAPARGSACGDARDLERIRAEGVLRMVTRAPSPGYFIHKGGDAGFEYELLRDFARAWGLRLEVAVAPAGTDLAFWLSRGKADVAAADLEIDPQTAALASFTLPCNLVRDVLVLPASVPGSDLRVLDGLAVHAHTGTAAWRTLVALRDELGFTCRPTPADTTLAVAALVAAVARGDLPATVAPLRIARAVLGQAPGGRIGPTLDEQRPIVWMVRRDSPDLLAALNAYLQEHFQITAEGIWSSPQWGELHDRYFATAGRLNGLLAAEHRPDLGGPISPFDTLLKAAADSADLDWRLVAAIAYEESRFDPQAVSHAGAIGLMQLRPRPDIPAAERLFEPETNVRAGVRFLKQIWDGYAPLDSLERLQLTLATYHAGAGNMARARRRAAVAGLDPNRWTSGLAPALRLLAQELQAQGAPPFHGPATIRYVNKVLIRHRLYSAVTAAAEFAPPRPSVMTVAFPQTAGGPWSAAGASPLVASARLAP